jgi:hypothetical protein
MKDMIKVMLTVSMIVVAGFAISACDDSSDSVSGLVISNN